MSRGPWLGLGEARTNRNPTSYTDRSLTYLRGEVNQPGQENLARLPAEAERMVQGMSGLPLRLTRLPAEADRKLGIALCHCILARLERLPGSCPRG